MRERCPSALFIGIAMMPDYRLAFTRRSITRDCGVADAVLHKNGKLWGVVYEIADLDIGKLDKSEGYQPGREKNSYWRRESIVFLDGNEQAPITVWTYFAERETNPPRPNQAYKDLILAGARYWQLPKDYINELERIEVAD